MPMLAAVVVAAVGKLAHCICPRASAHHNLLCTAHQSARESVASRSVERASCRRRLLGADRYASIIHTHAEPPVVLLRGFILEILLLWASTRHHNHSNKERAHHNCARSLYGWCATRINRNAPTTKLVTTQCLEAQDD
eukprot:6185041-Pleurochrysis_carterae.AAC.3